MLLQSEADLIALLGVVAAILLLLSVLGGVIAALKTFQVRQFQDMLFKAERKIDTLERRMFNVLNAVPVALVETEATGKFTFANKAAHQLLGRKDSELIGLRFHAATWGISYPDGRAVPGDLLPIARALRGQTVKGFQHMLTNHGSHDKVMVSVTAMPIMNSVGEVIGSTSALVEIETWTGEGVDDLTGAWRGHWFSAATVPFWGLDAQGQVLDVNAAALDAFDLRREDVLGRNWAQMFVADADFATALDYLGDIQDVNDTRQVSVTLNLKAQAALAAFTVTGWVVRTQEGGAHGLTVMGMPSDGVVRVIEAPAAVTGPSSGLSDDELQELEDFRSGERALTALGFGIWQFDPVADTIVEDAGMRALIGRSEPGGPTQISEDGQVLADAAFARLKSGEDDAMEIDILVADARWITLKGQASFENGERHIYGVAYDSTQWKTATTVVEVPVVAGLSDEAMAALKDEAYVAGLAAGRAEASAVAATVDGPVEGDVYAWRSLAAAVETVTVYAPDPAVIAENADLRQQVQALMEDIAVLRDRPAEQTVVISEADPAMISENSVLKAQLAVLSDELVLLRNRPVPEPVVISEPDPAVVAENAALKAQMAELAAEVESLTAAREAMQSELNGILWKPETQPDYSEHESRIVALEAQLDAARDRHDDLAQRYHVLSNAPDPEPDLSVYDQRIADLTDELNDVRDAHTVLKSRYAELAATPAPQPDYSAYEARLAAASNELSKWQAAHRDLQSRMEELSTALNQAQTETAGMQARIDQMNAALSNAQRFETVGRLTGDVAQDFAQMLQVVNGALDVMARTSESPENVRKLAQAALAAGKRGERLTRQLQAFQSEDY